MTEETAVQAAGSARDAYFRGLGRMSDDILAPIINPAFMGGPRWPSLRQGWRVIERGERTAMVSDGLSDPFDDVEMANNVGFGLEILVETAAQLDDVPQNTWLFDIVYQVAQNAADHGGFRELIERYGVVSMELPGAKGLESVMDANGDVGVLLGVEPPDFPTTARLPNGEVKIVTAKLLTPAELALAATGRQARERLRELFAEQKSWHLSDPARACVAALV